MSRFANSVMFTPVAGGTTDFVVSAAVQGFMTPALAGAPTGVYKYRAESSDLSQWEIGEGVYTSGTTTLTRTTVLYNSLGSGTATGQSGAGTKINFAAPPNVGMGLQSVEDTLSPDQTVSWSSAQALTARTQLLIPNGHYPGEPSNGAAAAGEIGEIVSYSGDPIGLTTGAAPANLVSGNFTAGDWDIRAFILVTAAGATSMTNMLMSVTATSGVHDNSTQDRYWQVRFAGGWADPIVMATVGPHQRLLSATTTLYVTGTAQFTSTLNMQAKLVGRRVR